MAGQERKQYLCVCVRGWLNFPRDSKNTSNMNPIGYPAMTKTTTTDKVQINTEGNLVGGHFCKCDCGQVITTKARYRPGHDARHAGIVARAIAENPKQANALLGTLPSNALQAKATRAAERLTTNTEVEATK